MMRPIHLAMLDVTRPVLILTREGASSATYCQLRRSH